MMFTKKQVRQFLPPAVLFSILFFLSEADLFEEFTPRINSFLQNKKLLLLHTLTDSGYFVVFLFLGFFFLRSFYLNKSKNIELKDYLGRLGVVFLSLSILFFLAIISNYYSFMWIIGLVKLLGLWYLLVFMNAAIRDRDKFMNMQSADQLKKMFEDVRDYFRPMEKEGEK